MQITGKPKVGQTENVRGNKKGLCEKTLFLLRKPIKNLCKLINIGKMISSGMKKLLDQSGILCKRKN